MGWGQVAHQGCAPRVGPGNVYWSRPLSAEVHHSQRATWACGGSGLRKAPGFLICLGMGAYASIFHTEGTGLHRACSCAKSVFHDAAYWCGSLPLQAI